MKTFSQKFLGVVAVLLACVFASCEPEFIQSNEDKDASGIPFHSPEFTLSVRSANCSKQVLANGSDGSVVKIDGARVMDLGLWLVKGNGQYATDTLFAAVSPTNELLPMEWTVQDPSIVEIVDVNEEQNYAVVRAKEFGTTTVTLKSENNHQVSLTATVTDAFVTGFKGNDSVSKDYMTENYTIYLESDYANSKRLSQYIWAKIEQSPKYDAAKDSVQYAPIEISFEGDDVLNVVRDTVPSADDPSEINFGFRVSGKAEGVSTLVLTCQYRQVRVLFTVKARESYPDIDSLQFVSNENVPLSKIWMSVGNLTYVNVNCYKPEVFAQYPDGYTWRALNPAGREVISLGTSGGDVDVYQRSIKAERAGEAQVEVALGVDSKNKTRTLDVVVCPAVTSISIYAVDGEGNTLTGRQSVPYGGTLQYKAVIQDQEASDMYGSLLRWKCNAPAQYMTIDPITGVLTAGSTPLPAGTEYYTVTAEITHPRFPGHETDHSTLTKVSNELQCATRAAATELNFVANALEYDFSGGYMDAIMFHAADGSFVEAQLYAENDDALRMEGVINIDGVDNSLTYVSGTKTYTFSEGTITVASAGAGAFTYTFDCTAATGDRLVGTSEAITPTVTE